MTSEIIIGVLGLIGTMIGTFGGILTANRLTTYRIEQLEEKVNKHNNLIERMYNVEGRLDVIEEKIKVENHRIDDLERGN